jgi:hypothetical protein
VNAETPTRTFAILASLAAAAALLAALTPTAARGAEYTISTADGNGADSEVRQFEKDDDPGQDPQTDVNFGNAESMGVRASTRRGFNASFLRFDLSGFAAGGFVGPATLSLTKYRDEDLNDITVFGLAESVDSWIEGNGGTDNSPVGELTYDNAPGILQDTDPLNGSDIDPAYTTDLGSFFPGGNEGDVLDFSNSALLGFLNTDTDGRVTFILNGPATSAKGLDMFATKETTALKSGATIPLGAGAPTLTVNTSEPEPEPADYAAIANAQANAMVDHGRDTYGSTHSPLFAAQMTRPDYSVPLDPHSVFPAMDDYGLRYDDRAWGSANTSDNVPLFKQLYKMSAATGDPKYAQAADDAIQYTFDNCRSPNTDLIAWGEEMSWMLHYDAPRLPGDGIMDGTYDGRPYDNDLHEPGGRWGPALWDKAFTLSAAGARAFAQGLWDHQIYDQATGDFSRHAKYTTHGPGSGPSFPRVGSWMMLAWAKAYEHVDGDPAFDAEMLNAIQTITGAYNARRDPTTDALPAGTDDRYDNVFWLTNNLTMAVEAGQMVEMGVLPQSVENLLNELAARTDYVILNLLDHNLDGHLNNVHPSFTTGFHHRGWTDVLENGYLKIGDPRHSLDDRASFTDSWTAGYGAPLTSSVALEMLVRYEQLDALGDPNASGYYDLAITAADVYLLEAPDTSLALHPSALAQAINLMLKAYALDGNQVYLDRAAYFGDWAAALFYDHTSALPKVTSQHDFYEALSGGDGLGLAMYDLGQAIPEPGALILCGVGGLAVLLRRRSSRRR